MTDSTAGAHDVNRTGHCFDGSAPKLSQAAAIRGEERSIPVMENPARNERHATQHYSKKQSRVIAEFRFQFSASVGHFVPW